MQPLTSGTKIRLYMAMLCFAALATMAGLTLEDWRLRAVVWIVLGGLAMWGYRLDQSRHAEIRVKLDASDAAVLAEERLAVESPISALAGTQTPP